DIDRKPGDIAADLDPDQRRLYELVWKRTGASQMSSALLEQVTVDIADPTMRLRLRANGSVVIFDGFFALYQEDRDDTADEEGEGRRLPARRKSERRGGPGCRGCGKRARGARGGAEPKRHFPQPPPRYTEASLVKKLEELGIGRPSTYASIISTIQDRGYVRLEDRRFRPEDVGYVVTDKLVEHFPDIVNPDFT